jgi:hypothetical protein
MYFACRLAADFRAWLTSRVTVGHTKVGAQVTKDGPGVRSQGKTTPLAVFGSHEVAKIKLGGGVKRFDPSYGNLFSGATDTDLLLAFQNGSLDFFGKQRSTDMINVTVTLIPITATTTDRYLIRLP